ncbi:MAG: 2-phosphosulfolactate phosphatase, partial [Ignavibacteria bacterium]|nr:2-phosphosulfolactate phosphatase [Ignavibacteria bacterium]
NVLFSPGNTDELYFTGKTTVVVDVLRASTTIVEALKNGAKDVVPVATVEFAVKISGGMFCGQTLLGGERNTKKIEGFALGNSPLEYKSEIVNGKSIVFYSTNGTKAIVKAKFSEHLFISALTNMNAVAKHLLELGSDCVILCAGNNNLFSLEDSVCAGALIEEIINLEKTVLLSDSAKAALGLNKSFGKNKFNTLTESEHGKILIKNGFNKDLEFCSKENNANVVPVYSNSVIKTLG